ncbi:hypothetical protein THAOC_30389, partial [Thalassiosira oceanica]
CSDDFPTNRRVHADPIVETSEELASRLQQFIEEEDHDANITRLLARAAEHKAGGPKQKRNSHQHNKSRLCSILRPFRRVLHASGRTTLTCERYNGGTIYAVGCSDYIWTVDEKLEMLLPTPTDYGYAKVDEDGELVYSSSPLAETSSEIAERGSRRRSLAWPQREQAQERQREAFKPVSGPRAEPEIISLHPRKPNHSPDANMIPDDSDDDSVDSRQWRFLAAS